MNRSSTVGFSFAWAAFGSLMGVLIFGMVGLTLWCGRVIPTRNPRPLELSVQSLPEQVLGFQRVDVELRKQPELDGASEQLAWEAEYDSALEPSFRDTYGGDGVTTRYGEMLGRMITVTAVNGDINAPVTTTSEWIAHINGITPGLPLAVAGTAGTTCTYNSYDHIPLPVGQTVEQLVSDVLDSRPASGLVECVRRNVDRNLSVSIAYNVGTDDGKTASQAAGATAAETDRVWEALD